MEVITTTYRIIGIFTLHLNIRIKNFFPEKQKEIFIFLYYNQQCISAYNFSKKIVALWMQHQELLLKDNTKGYYLKLINYILASFISFNMNLLKHAARQL